MNKFFFLIFIIFSALIIYQGILGKNGVMEKYSIEKEREKLKLIIQLLQNEINENENYISELKNNPEALESLANELGFFRDRKRLIKVIEDYDNERPGIVNSGKSDKTYLIRRVKESNEKDEKIEKIRLIVKISFYSVFGLIIILIIFGMRRKSE